MGFEQLWPCSVPTYVSPRRVNEALYATPFWKGVWAGSPARPASGSGEKRLGGYGREAGAILAQQLLAQVGQVHGAEHVHHAVTHVKPDVLDHGDAGARVPVDLLAHAAP